VNETLPTIQSLVELDDLAYYVATTYGEPGRKKCLETSIGFTGDWDGYDWRQRDEQAYLRLSTSGLWTLAYLPARQTNHRAAEQNARAWLRADDNLYRVSAENSIKDTPKEILGYTTARERLTSPLSIQRAKVALEIMYLRLANPV
jgi:hypothetical protein